MSYITAFAVTCYALEAPVSRVSVKLWYVTDSVEVSEDNYLMYYNIWQSAKGV